MALDVGEVRIGIALTDPLRMIASPYDVYVRKNTEADIDYFIDLIKSKKVSELIIGLPKHLDGNEGKTAKMIRDFAETLTQKSDVKIVFQDERFTSKSADQFLISNNMRRSKRKNVIDKMAAQIILQNYLDKMRNL
ncbi:MAG: Holliday junction resolvase RuvX [Clostridia bacterium]